MNRKSSFLLRRVTLSCLVAAVLALPAQADVNNDLNKFFNKLGFEGNATGAAAWQGQAAGYMTGGNLFLRSPVKQMQVMSFTPPSLNAGCGGIDAYLGSFSFINSDQLQQFIKNLMANAQGYFFDLALQTVAPELKDAKDYLQKLAADVERVVAQPDVQAKFASLGMELALQTPAQFDAFVAREYEKWSRVIKQAGIEAN